MRITHYTDPTDNQVYREIIADSYTALNELKKSYEQIGKRTWINLYSMDPCDSLKGTWLLTVKL